MLKNPSMSIGRGLAQIITGVLFSLNISAHPETSDCPRRLESVFLKAAAQNPNLVAYENKDWIAIFDTFPSRPGHILIVPRRIFESYFEINHHEWFSLNDAFLGAREAVQKRDLKGLYSELAKAPLNEASAHFLKQALTSPFIAKQPQDFTIAVNEGRHAGRSVDHLHIHLVPRFEGDVPDPTGGFRHMFPKDGNYLKLGVSLNALDAASKYYNDGNTALSYFRKIREMRGVMPALVEWEKKFPKNARVLEVGFGPGIEFEFLLGKGYPIDGIDISHPMKIQLERMLDQKLTYEWRKLGQLFPYSLQEFQVRPKHYDRIWASATFLHVDKREIPEMLARYGEGLADHGELFVNFKVGDGPTRLDNEGRPFSYFTEESFKAEVMPHLPNLMIKQIETSGSGEDKLGRADTRWLNIILAPKR